MGRAGTTMLWRHLHRFDVPGVAADDVATEKHFYEEIRWVEAHLGIIAGRFLSGPLALKLGVSGNPVQPWDPFLQHRRFAQRLPAEEIPVSGHVIRVAGFVLPHLRYLSDEEARRVADPRGWLKQQGFYVYRRDRLILAGDWLGIRGFRNEDKYILARVAVDIPAELDSEWKIDVRKSAVIPPLAARPHLHRIGAAARRAAAAVVTHRGRVTARERGTDFVYAWTVHRANGQVTCRVNRKHPLVPPAAARRNRSVADATALLRLLEETVPVAALRVMHQAETVDDPEPFTGAAERQVKPTTKPLRSLNASSGRSTPRGAHRTRAGCRQGAVREGSQLHRPDLQSGRCRLQPHADRRRDGRPSRGPVRCRPLGEGDPQPPALATPDRLHRRLEPEQRMGVSAKQATQAQRIMEEAQRLGFRPSDAAQ